MVLLLREVLAVEKFLRLFGTAAREAVLDIVLEHYMSSFLIATVFFDYKS